MSFHTLGTVHSVIAAVLGFALLSTWGHVSALHIHAYTDHDHPEHHHGLAAHEHEHATATRAPDGTVHLETCNPSRHTISFVFVCAAPPQTPVVDAEFVSPAVPDRAVPPCQVIDVTDIRVHGPPSLTQASPRGPPLIFPA